jgi:hypothetical protein
MLASVPAAILAARASAINDAVQGKYFNALIRIPEREF